jgi:hypothetical protein
MVLALTGAGLTGDTTAPRRQRGEAEVPADVRHGRRAPHGVRWTKLGKILISHDMRGSR